MDVMEKNSPAIDDKMFAFRMFFNENYPKVKAFAYKMLKSEADAEDLAQDIFIKLWEKPDIWENCSGAEAYLYTIVRNRIFNIIKHKQVESSYKNHKMGEQNFRETDGLDPHKVYRVKELEILVQMSVERMPEQRRKIYQMSRIKNMSSAEIAEVLGLSVRTVENHIYKALQDLKKITMCLIFF